MTQKVKKNDLPEIDWKGRILSLIGIREIFEVEGDSMSPTLNDGDLVLVNFHTEFKVGDIILANHPFDKGAKLIKRIWKISPEGNYFLIGDNLAKSTDSRNFGELLAKEILGKIEAKLNKSNFLNIG